MAYDTSIDNTYPSFCIIQYTHQKYFIKLVVGDHNVYTSALNNLILSSGNAIVIYI